MTSSNKNKIAGSLISAAIGFSFVVTTDVSAAPVFPPQHYSTQANFDEANRPAVSCLQAPNNCRRGR